MFQEIISKKNIAAAYIELTAKLAQAGKIERYSGLDGLKFQDINWQSREICRTAEQELKNYKKIQPALAVLIPKRGDVRKKREIFIYNFLERLKAEAIYRVILPVFEANFSPFLFSYRPGKSFSHAARSVGSRRQRHPKDYVLTIDLNNYSENISQAILLEQLKKLVPEKETYQLLSLFIGNQFYRDGQLITPLQGLVQGVPLIALFANLYLNDFDKQFGPQVSLYRRVGDDLIFMDPDRDKIERLEQEARQSLTKLGLIINQMKSRVSGPEEPVFFLGYCFSGAKISLEESFVKKVFQSWSQAFNRPEQPLDRKFRKIRQALGDQGLITNQFYKIIYQKNLVNDSRQIREMSEKLFVILTKYLFKAYSPRRRRLAAQYFKELDIPSLYNLYKKFHYER